MAFVVADPCVNCRYTDCVAVCPVDCFYQGMNMLVIHPEECIDCGACEPECPATAIYEEDDLPGKWQMYAPINAVYSGHEKVEDADTTGWPQPLLDGATAWPNISEQCDPLPGAEEASKYEDKLEKLDPAPGDS